MKILITGSAGFIGYHTSKRFCAMGNEVVGIDSINSYYDISLKYSRLEDLGIYKDDISYGKIIVSKLYKNFSFIQLDFSIMDDLKNLRKFYERFDLIIHLGAQAGVRYSISNPDEYLKSNLIGFYNILEFIKDIKPNLFIYASSSSVYGLNKKVPFEEVDNTDKPISLYAATKKSNEVIAYSYSSLYNISMIGLRFFTVYGPFGRPDMAYYKFTDSILNDKVIEIYNNGNMRRDFTYIEDIVEGIYMLSLEKKFKDQVFYDIFNIGNNNPTDLMYLIELIEGFLGKKAMKNMLPIQAGDVYETYASVEKITEYINFKPKTTIEKGLLKFINWYKNYNHII